MASYERGGALDPSFDGDGKVVTDMRGQPQALASSVGLDPDGRIVVGGITTDSRPSAGLAIPRYLAAAPPHQGYWHMESPLTRSASRTATGALRWRSLRWREASPQPDRAAG